MSQAAERLLLVVGPTAAGKTELAVRLARALDGEVVSVDSMQVYRHFDVGTAKPTAEERQGVPHHLIDVVQPDEAFSAARFVELADRAIAQILTRGRSVVLAGGTGLYLRALIRGLFQAPPPDEAIRAQLALEAERLGTPALHARLAQVDPAAASRINPNDLLRISRALEVYRQVGRPISELQAEHRFAAQRYRTLRIGVAPERAELRRRIDERVDRMLAQGWLDEVQRLVALGYGDCEPMGALGYRQLRAVTLGTLDLNEAVRQTKRDTWRFARRQLNWFSSNQQTEWFGHPGEVDVARVVRRLRR